MSGDINLKRPSPTMTGLAIDNRTKTVDELRLVAPKEAASILGIGVSALYALMRRGELPFIKIGRSTRIELAAIRVFEDQKRIGSALRMTR